MIRMPVVVTVLLALSPNIGLAQQSQLYTLSNTVQLLAEEHDLYGQLASVYEELSASDLIVLYLDTLTATDITASFRASLLGNRVSGLDDYGAAGWSWCWMPWPPPKDPEDRDMVRRQLAELVNGAFVNPGRRKAIVENLDSELLLLSATEMSQREVSALDILNLR